MTDTSTRHPEEVVHEVDVGVLPSSPDAEALFKEARRRRRRRRVAVVLVFVLLAALVVAGAILAGSGSNGRPRNDASHPPAPSQHPSPQKNNQKNNKLGPASAYPPAQSMGIADSEVLWAVDGVGLYLTTNGARTWRAATPPNVHGVTVSEHITALDAVGTNDLWVVIDDMPGLVPFGQSANGSVRGQGIDRSTDGGRTWTFTALPGCLQTCGPLSLSFVDATHGFAATSPFTGDSTLFATQDGGVTWTQVAAMSNLGSDEVLGPIAQPKIVFASSLDGWAITGPGGSGAHGQPTDPGGVLYRTTDGGATWVPAPGLPSGFQYSLPAVFGNGQAVVLATQSPSDARGAAVYETNDGGSIWTRHPLPVIRGNDVFTPGSLLTRFAASSPSAWKIAVGTHIYETSDAGRAWAVVTPTPKTSLGDPTAVLFSSSEVGMAITQLPTCYASSIVKTENVCYPVLIVTSDGGRTWSPASLPNEPPWHSTSP